MLHEMGCQTQGIEREGFTQDDIPGVPIHKKALDEIGFPSGYFDMVVLWHVLEHLPDPANAVLEIARILRPGGILALAVPNFSSVQRQLFGPFWFHLDLPRHTHHFGSRVLENHLSRAGFSTRRQTTFSLEQNPYGFVQSFLNMLFPNCPPNRLYELLKAQSRGHSVIQLVGWLGLASLVIPFALLETAVTGLLGSGATIMLYAERLTDDPQ
jgi:SAM-dependent methyltransferase